MIYFPHPLSSNDEGLLAIGGELSLERLKLAYKFGIFPWYNQPPILWWFTHPRCVISPNDLIISKSMKSLVNNKRPWQLTFDYDFEFVIDQCAHIKRPKQRGTWITQEMRDAFLILHIAGFAHSLEVWNGNEIIGGLYGVAMGKIFYGESMFSEVSNASKYAFIHLAQYLGSLSCELIDCQQDTPHMRSMGASLISKQEYWKIIKSNINSPDMELTSESFKQWLDSVY